MRAERGGAERKNACLDSGEPKMTRLQQSAVSAEEEARLANRAPNEPDQNWHFESVRTQQRHTPHPHHSMPRRSWADDVLLHLHHLHTLPRRTPNPWQKDKMMRQG